MTSYRSVSVDGATLNVLEAGQGPAVLLIHGFPDDHQVWRKQIPALVAAGYKVIAPDTRGCGESSLPGATSDYHLSKLTQDLDTLLTELGHKKVHVIGHDWGSIIGWFFTMNYPHRVNSYTAMSVGHPLAYAQGGLAQKIKGWYTAAFQLRKVAEFLMRTGNWFAIRQFVGQAEETPRWIEKLQRPGRLTAGLNYYRANVSLILPRKYPDIHVPVMGIYSDGDRFLSESQMKNSGQIVKGPWRYEKVVGASHWFQIEKPEETSALLVSFLDSQTKQSRQEAAA